ncbi:hypothetical protein RhiirA5_386670, partial [Rhizophagus irregularis]
MTVAFRGKGLTWHSLNEAHTLCHVCGCPDYFPFVCNLRSTRKVNDRLNKLYSRFNAGPQRGHQDLHLSRDKSNSRSRSRSNSRSRNNSSSSRPTNSNNNINNSRPDTSCRTYQTNNNNINNSVTMNLLPDTITLHKYRLSELESMMGYDTPEDSDLYPSREENEYHSYNNEWDDKSAYNTNSQSNLSPHTSSSLMDTFPDAFFSTLDPSSVLSSRHVPLPTFQPNIIALMLLLPVCNWKFLMLLVYIRIFLPNLFLFRYFSQSQIKTKKRTTHHFLYKNLKEDTWDTFSNEVNSRLELYLATHHPSISSLLALSLDKLWHALKHSILGGAIVSLPFQHVSNTYHHKYPPELTMLIAINKFLNRLLFKLTTSRPGRLAQISQMINSLPTQLTLLKSLLIDYTIPIYSTTPLPVFVKFLHSQKALVSAYLFTQFQQHRLNSVEYYTALRDEHFSTSPGSFISSALSVEHRSIILDRVLVVIDSKPTLLTDPLDIKQAAIKYFQS